jgi:S-DNA-T family DNA segregation ATPase FtsK/SpoIIIE
MSIAVPQRFDVRLTFVGADEEPIDLLVGATTASTAAELAAALGQWRGHPVELPLYNARSGPLTATRRLSDGLLRDGDVVHASPPSDAAATRVGSGDLELWVVGGPGAGRRVPLAGGDVVIGRDRDVDVRIDDPSLSRRHARVTVGNGSASVADAGSSNGTAVDGRRLGDGERVLLGPGDHVEVGRSLLRVRPAARTDDTVARAHGARIDFNRMPRMAAAFEPAVVEVAPPPDRPGGVRLPLAASIGPLVLGVVMFVVIKQPTMLLFSALTPIMAVSSYISDRRGGRKAYASRLAVFRARAAQLDGELRGLRVDEIAARRRTAPDPATLAAVAARHLPELWERRRGDDDFLSLRLGIADQPAAFIVKFPDGGEAAEREPVESAIRQSVVLPAIPLCVKALDIGGIGLSGDRPQSEALARWLVVQAAVLHSPRELLVLAALSDEHAAGWEWLAWLPHAASTRAVVDHTNIAVGPVATASLLRAVAEVVQQRRDEAQQRFSSRQRSRPALMVVIDEDVAPSRALVDELLADATETEVTIVWLGRRRRELPGGCAVVVELDAKKSAMAVAWPRDGFALADATPDGLSPAIAEEVARALAPVRDVTQARSAASIPRSAPLLEILDAVELDDEQVSRRWAAAAGGTLAAPLGVSPDGLFAIDLRRDGPHGLVAGTTGAGKSELLQSLVAGMALSQPPTRVSFLLIDYKGGAAFKDCVHLPHTVGMVTDLDEHLTRRALLSLNAELRRREHVLNAAGVRDLAELERRRPDEAPASLVIVIDEFAALKNEVPEFVDGVVDIAQRGRSLGVHLVLATQRPGGVVSDNIRANTNLRIALRVQQPSESDDVIGDHAAARISKSLPGRAYARTGHSELAELQSAYVGGRVRRRTSDADLSLTRLAFGEAVLDDRDAGADEEAPSDLERIVEAVTVATRRAGLPLPPSPWLPELAETLTIEELDELDEAPHVIPLGRVDEPRRQRQATWGVDLERDGSLFIYGASGAGKTTLLRTIAVQLARRSEPRHLHLYGMDFGGHGLAPLESLPHCGAVIVGEDEERVTRLLALLRREIDERGKRFAERRVATLSELRAVADPADWPPRIVLLLDSYAGFTEAFDAVNMGALTQLLPRIVSEGRAAGVHVIATADRRNAVPHAVNALVQRRIVLRLADEDEYATLGLDRKGVQGAVLPVGRGFVDDTLELQTATVGTATAIVDEGRRLTALHGGDRAPAVPSMPSELSRAQLPRSGDARRPVLGVDEPTLGVAHADITESSFLICGPYRSGRTTALATIARSLREADPELELHLLAPRRSALPTMEQAFTSIARGADQCAAAAQRLLETVLARSPDDPHPLLAIVIDDVGELLEGPAASALESLVRRSRDVEVRIIASCENQAARGFSQTIRELRKDGNGLLLEPSIDVDGDLLGVRLPRRTNLVLPPGRGFLVSNGVPVLVQVAAQEI